MVGRPSFFEADGRAVRPDTAVGLAFGDSENAKSKTESLVEDGGCAGASLVWGRPRRESQRVGMVTRPASEVDGPVYSGNRESDRRNKEQSQ